MSSICSAARRARSRVAQDGLGEVGAPDRQARRPGARKLAVVELEAELAQAGGHPQRALLAVGEKARERRSKAGLEWSMR